MTAEEVLRACGERNLCRHKEQVFFLTSDENEMRRFLELGARMIAFCPTQWSRPQARMWEVHVHHMCNEVWVEDIFGEKKLDRSEQVHLLNLLRERDGVAFAFQRPGPLHAT